MAVESYANNASTTLSAAITSTGATSITVTSATGFPSSGQYRIIIDSELLLVTGGQGTTTWTVTRGVESTSAATHLIAIAVTQVMTAASLLNAPGAMTTRGDLSTLNSTGQAARLALGAVNTVLHGSATDPNYSAVVEGDLGLTDITTANVSTTKHGFAPKAPNDATKFLDGTGAFSTPAGGAAGALVFLEAHTASSSATLDFTTFISSTYDDYVFKFVQIVPATNNVTFECQAGTGGGPTYDTGANYQSTGWYNGIGDTLTGNSGSGLTFGRIANSITTTTNWSVNGRMLLYGPGSAVYKNWLTEVTAPVTNQYYWSFASVYLSATVLTAIRFLMSSGNIASGTIRVYGISKT